MNDLFIFILRKSVFFFLHVRLCEGVGSPKARVTDSYDLLRGYWELSMVSLEEQSVFLTAKLSLQSLCMCSLLSMRLWYKVFGLIHFCKVGPIVFFIFQTSKLRPRGWVTFSTLWIWWAVSWDSNHSNLVPRVYFYHNITLAPQWNLL